MLTMKTPDFIKVLRAGGRNREEQLPRAQLLGLLDTHGALLIRDIEFDLDAFEAFTAGLCNDFHDVGTRVKLKTETGDGYSTQVHRQNFTLLSHSEGTYRPWPPPPELCFFYCLTAPMEKGGETTLVDGVDFLQEMPGRLRERFMQSDIIYEMDWQPERWQAEFQVASLRELEKLLGENPALEYQFRGENLALRYKTSAINQTRTGQPAFANALLAHLPRITHPAYRHNKVYTKSSNHVYFEGGEEIPDELINALIDIQDRLMYLHEWRCFDLLVIDNTRLMHGRRMTMKNCERVLLSRFGTPGAG